MSVDKSGERVRRMFAEIARRYDFMNHLLSAGIDRRWRRRVIRLVPPEDEGPILDVCCGTGDLTLGYWQAGRGRIRVVGADFCRPMLERGTQKIKRLGAAGYVDLVEADAQQLPFHDGTFQIVSVAFGLRNISDTNRGLCEMARVCRVGGRVAVLEFSLPKNRILKALYGWYFRRILPRIGQALAKNRQAAYNYLPDSVGEFPQHEALAKRMRAAGLSEVSFHPLTFGIATLYLGTKV